MNNPHCKIACRNNVRKRETLGDEANHEKEIFRMIDKKIDFFVTKHRVK